MNKLMFLLVAEVLLSVIPAPRSEGADRQPAPDLLMSDAAPQLIVTEGAIVTLDLTSPRPNLLVVTEEGKGWMLAMDPKAEVLGNHADGLSIGQHVQVSHVLADGLDHALSVQIDGSSP